MAFGLYVLFLFLRFMRVNTHIEKKPWGEFEVFTPFTVPSRFEAIKVITVNPDSELSLQYHDKRDEFFKIIGGRGQVRVGEDLFDAKEGDEFFIPKKTRHQVLTTDSVLKILEISFDEFDENDIVRLKDKYGRV